MVQASQVNDYFRHPRLVGSIPADAADVGTGRVESPGHGDVARLQVRVEEATGVIQEARFKAYGCSFAIASASFVADQVMGRTLVSALTITADEIGEKLSLPATKQYCAQLAYDAIRAAIADYETKRDAKAHLTTEDER